MEKQNLSKLFKPPAIIGMLACLFILFIASQAQGAVRYVKPVASGTGDGSSWANASANLQAMINASNPGDQVWVAAGTYKPTTGTDRNISFVMKNGVGIYGGFPNSGNPVFSNRNWTANVTTLSGEIGAPDISDNSYHVVYNDNNGLGNSAVLDGFTISGGNANGNVEFFTDAGGGIYNASVSPTIINCTIKNNEAAKGGGVFNRLDAFPNLINCTFSGNFGTQGGAMYNVFNGSPNITNCTFSGNSSFFGGAMANWVNSSPIVANSIFWGNTVGEIANTGSGGAAVITYSIVQGGYSGTGNLNADPLFVNAGGSDFRLQACSPAINKATSSGAPASDLDGNPRPVNTGYDMGAYEYQSGLPSVTAFCQNQTVYLNAAGNATLAASALNNGSTGCAPLSYTIGGQPTMNFSCANQGNNTVTLTVTDLHGTTSTCNATVTVVDNINPTISCPAPITVNVDPGRCDAKVLYPSPTASDNCAPATPAGYTYYSQGGGSYYYLSNTTANYATARANARADGGHLAVVTSAAENALIPPPIAWLGGSDASSEGTWVWDTYEPFSYTNWSVGEPNNSGDEDGIITWSGNKWNDHKLHIPEKWVLEVEGARFVQTAGLGQNAIFPKGTTTNTFVVTDASGNTNTCSFTVTVVDNIPPNVVCKNTTVALSASGQASIVPADVFQSGNDNCGTVNLQSVSPNSFTCANVGPNAVTLTVNDGNGNQKTCTATVTVQDNVDPVAQCQNVTVQLDAAGNGSTTAAAVNNGSSDACGIQTLSLSQTNFTCANVGGNSVTLTVTDNNGNQSTCTATVTVEDNVDPVAICQDVTVQLDSEGSGSAMAVAVNNGSSDACGIQSLSLSQSAFDCSHVGGNSVTLTVTDNNGNQSTCTATVTVEDNVDPVAQCQDVTVQLDSEGSGSAMAVAVNNGSSDACGIQTLSLSQTSFTCANVGGNSVTLTVTDNNGNQSTCNATVTVKDEISPTIVCPANVTVNNDMGECSAIVNYTVTANDNCSFSTNQTTGIASNLPHPVGVTTNTWLATDASGNTATCSFTVTVNKSGDPELLWAYTAIGLDEVKMKNNTVMSGGVGVVNSGKKAKLEHNTMVTAANTFVKAPQLDLNGGSQVTNYYPGQVDGALLPAFQSNTSTCSNNLNIPDNSAPVVLNLACYKDVTIGKNVSVTFSGNATVQVKDLKVKEGATISFAQGTNLLIDKKLDTDKNVSISNGGNMVWIYVEDHAKIDDGNNLMVNIYCQKHIHVDKTPSGNPTYMTGVFIAEKIDSKENVFWNWDANVCPNSAPLLLTGLPNETTTPAMAPEVNNLELSIYPNPASRMFTLQLGGVEEGEASVQIFDQMGRLVMSQRMEAGQIAAAISLDDFDAGIYVVTATFDGKKVTKRLAVVK